MAKAADFGKSGDAGRSADLAAALPVKRIVLFGSYAAGRHTAASDIDLLVVYSGPPREDAFRIVRTVLNLRRLEPHVYAEEEYEGVRGTVERMIREGVPILER